MTTRKTTARNIASGSLLCAAGCALLLNAVAARAGEARFVSSRPGHVFAEENGEVRLLLSGGKVAGGAVVAEDEAGRELFRLPVAADAASVAVALSERGFYALRADIAWGDAPAAPAAAATAAVVGPPTDAASRRGSPFGFFAVASDDPLERAANSAKARHFVPTNAITREQADSLLPGSDTGWVPPPHPLPSWWGRPSRWTQGTFGALMGAPNWTMADEVKGAASPTKYFPPKDWEAFARTTEYALLTMGLHYEGVELLNEPDANWRGTDAELVRMLAAIRAVQKRVRPELKLLAPCSYAIRLEYLQRLADLGMFEHIDGLVVHHYASDAAPEGDWYEKLLALRVWLKKWGKEDLPVYITEYGWQTAKGDWARPVTIRDQGYFAARGAVLMRTIDPASMNYFCLGWRGTKNPIHNGWAVTEENGQPRPAYAALAHVYRALADARGPGRVLRPAPDIWMAAFRRADGRAVAAAWTTGPERALALPGGAAAAGVVRGLAGRPVALDKDGRIPVGPGVVFFDLADDAWLAADMAEPVTATPGDETTLAQPLAGAWSAGAVAVAADDAARVRVPADAAPGEYLLLGRADGRMRWQPVRVLPPWTVASAETAWPADAAEPRLVMTLASNGTERRLLPLVRVDKGADRFAKAVDVAPGRPQTVTVPLPGLADGRAHTLRAVAEFKGEDASVTLEERFIPAPRVAGGRGGIDWDKIPAVTSEDWVAVSGTALAPEDCSARLQAAYGDDGVHLRVTVRDDVHRQGREPEQLWAEDALQIAFDPDSDRPWRPNLNNDVDGFNGHRVFEYSAGMRDDGTAVQSRGRAEAVKLAPGAEKIAATVAREGDLTRYDLTFPWASLGLEKPMAAGRPLGFSLLVNDSDEPRQRKGLALFGGIFDDKDPKHYGRLWLRP